MNIPGFNAEASLGAYSGHYVSAGFGQYYGVLPVGHTPTGLGGIDGVVPQRMSLCGCDPTDSECIQCCLCIRHGGHPRNCCM